MLDQALAGLLEEVDASEAQAPDLSPNNDLLDEELARKFRNQGFAL